ncbi:MAG: class I SAM-dependent methyltransferase [Variibacter sp.]
MISIRENGLLYFFYLGISYLGTTLSDFGFRKSDALRKAKNLPGMNSRAANKYIWDNWDWSSKGDEWTPSAAWKTSVVKTFITPYFKDADTVLEIGPGAGRWTEYLLSHAKRLIAIDISEACVSECRKRFASYPQASFEVGNGFDLHTISANSIDRIWSFDVFVHINGTEFNSYVAEFHRVLKAGGIGAIHHGSLGGSSGGWRSNVTLTDVQKFMRENDLEIISQVKSWIDDGEEHQAGLYGDAITVFRKN